MSYNGSFPYSLFRILYFFLVTYRLFILVTSIHSDRVSVIWGQEQRSCAAADRWEVVAGACSRCRRVQRWARARTVTASLITAARWDLATCVSSFRKGGKADTVIKQLIQHIHETYCTLQNIKLFIYIKYNTQQLYTCTHPHSYFTTNLGQLFSLIKCYNLAHDILQ